MAGFRASKVLAILYSLVCINELFCSNEVKAVSEGSARYEGTIHIKMPGTRPLKKDAYLCTALQLPPTKQYIVRLEPNATQQTAHHMLLYGCSSPGAQLSSWYCQRGPCNGEQNIIYAWAKDAPSRNLPKDVGIGIGGDSGIRYLVLQVHYASVIPFEEGAKDFSGFTLRTSQHQLPYGAAIYLLWAGRGSIPPETSGMHVDVGCTYNEPEPMFAFAFRTHAHKLAKVITGYRVRNGVWTLLGKGNPQAPQAFYPMESTIEIKEGDMLVARCTYDSKGHDIHRVIHMGPSGDDEMCNFYIMYYSDAGRLEYSGGDCGQQNHPNVFKNFPPDSDTLLTDSPDLKDRESSVPIISTPVVYNKTSPDQETRKETAMVPVSFKISTDSPTRGTSQELDISDLGSAKEELPSAKAETQVGTEPSSQEHPALKENQPIIPVATSTPVIPVPQSTDEKELRVVSDWPSLTAVETSKLGQVTGVSLDSMGQVIVFHRGSRTWDDHTFDSSNVFQNADVVGTIKEHAVWIIDSSTGKIKGFWGKDMFFLPHGLTVDHEDNLWLTDVGSHQVFKFSPLGSSTQRLMSLGDKLVPGSDKSRFCQPTSVAVDRNGEFFVADGYCNSRILKFSAAGKLLSSLGEMSVSSPGIPAPGSLFIPHSLSMDQSSHTLYVADRENGRVQSFNSISGAFVDEIKLPEFGGKVFAVDFSVRKQGGVLHVVNGQSQKTGVQHSAVQGFTIRVADKVILQTWPSDREQALVQPHDVVSSADGSDVYVVELGPNRIWKLSSKRQVDSFSNKTSSTPVNTVPVKTSDHVTQSSHTILGETIDGLNPKQEESENTSTKGMSTHRASADPEQLKQNRKKPSLSPVAKTGVIGQPSPKPTETVTVKNNSVGGPQDDTLSSEDNVDITAGIIPALIILSVLAVPIVFLLLISITLRVRAYRRDKRNQMSDFHEGRKDFSVGRTRGWWSYMNCFDRQKYKFNRVTLQDFYSDSDSDGV